MARSTPLTPDVAREAIETSSCSSPAKGFDFEPGVMPSRRGPHTTCGSRVIMLHRWRRRAIGVDAVYYSPDGTALGLPAPR